MMLIPITLFMAWYVTGLVLLLAFADRVLVGCRSNHAGVGDT